ncbi:MAG: serine/threonine protein kinase, partial [Phycisphaerae bacterium]|nr:serine/threonine protein kinase [Phycisphaerae bacterium]
MSNSSRESVEQMVDAVRRGWASLPDGPDLGQILSGGAAADDGALIEVLLADAEERSERGLDDGIGLYMRVVPGLPGRHEVVRAVLMHVIASRQGAERGALIESLKERYPPMAGEIAVLAELCDELADSFSIPAEAAADPVAGQVLGKYRLVQRLGRGSFGEVWQALDSELDRYVALKILHRDATRGEQATLERALAEARAAAALAHEHIVTVHAVGRLDELSRFYIDSALVGEPRPTVDDPKRIELGMSLDAWVTRGGRRGLAPREAASLMSAVCRGIAAAHGRGVMHRDIKPANILVTPSGKPLVADFGLSTTGHPLMREEGDASQQSVSLRSESGRRIVGTPAYMSPEQAAGERPTPLSDVYSLGATLRFVLTGAPPFVPSGRFSTDARWDVIAQVRDSNRPTALRDPRVPAALSAICARAMARRPEDRYVSAAEFAEDLEAWLAHRPIRAMPSSTLSSAVLWFRRNTALGTVGVAAALALTAGAAA